MKNGWWSKNQNIIREYFAFEWIMNAKNSSRAEKCIDFLIIIQFFGCKLTFPHSFSIKLCVVEWSPQCPVISNGGQFTEWKKVKIHGNHLFWMSRGERSYDYANTVQHRMTSLLNKNGFSHRCHFIVNRKWSQFFHLISAFLPLSLPINKLNANLYARCYSDWRQFQLQRVQSKRLLRCLIYNSSQQVINSFYLTHNIKSNLLKRIRSPHKYFLKWDMVFWLTRPEEKRQRRKNW